VRRSAAFCSKSLINDLGCEEARQWYAISYLGKRWWATYASPRRDGTGLQRFQVGAAENAWRPSPPPCPLLSHSVGEEGGDERSRGDSGLASVNDAVSTTQITPLPQRGSGAGGEGRPQCGSGAGGEGCPHAMIARARYMPNEKFLIRLSDVLKGVHQCSNDRSVLNNDVARTS
jgi:hypothetical protein